MRCLSFFCSQSVKDLFLCLPFGKRVQRYGLFSYQQNLLRTFFEKNCIFDGLEQKRSK